MYRFKIISLIFIFLLCFTDTVFTQSLSDGIQFNDTTWNYLAVEKKMDRQLERMNNVQIFSPGKKWFGDTLQYLYNHYETTIVHRYMFEKPNNRLKSTSKVIYQEFRTACDRCGDELVAYLTDKDKKYGFKKSSDGSYLSKLKYKTKMWITTTENDETCLRIVFLPLNVSDEEYLMQLNSNYDPSTP